MIGTMALIALLWFGISAPLSAIGSFYGSKHGVRTDFRLFGFLPDCFGKQALKHPVRVNPIPRQIPPAPWYLRPWVRFPLLGLRVCAVTDILSIFVGVYIIRWHPSIR